MKGNISILICNLVCVNVVSFLLFVNILIIKLGKSLLKVNFNEVMYFFVIM